MDSLKPKIEISDESFEKSADIDKADRKGAILHFKKIIDHVFPPYTIAINGAWGTGKTVFLKMLKNELRKDQRVVYHSAWEHDYSSDPLLSLMLSLKNEFHDVNKFVELMESAGRIVLASLPQLASVLTLGAVNSELTEKLVSSIASAVGKEASKNRDAIVEFRGKLQALVNSEVANKKLIIIIDDLDRCKPTYAIEVLENIKHLFNIDRVVFLIGIDKDQLQHSINAVYGSGYDSKRYLQRFFDLDYNLPQMVTDDYINHVVNELGLYKFFKPRKHELGNGIIDHPSTQIKIVIFTFNTLYSFDLRQIQRILHRFALLALMANSEEEVEPIFMLTLLILYHYDKETYDLILSRGDYDIETLNKYWNLSENSPFRKAGVLCGVVAGMILARKVKNREEITAITENYSNYFSDSLIASWYSSEVYIKRTENFINASNDFVSR